MAEATATQAAETAPRTLNGIQAVIATVKGWPISRKIILAAVLLITLALFAVIIIQARTANYQVLYGNLTEADAAAVVEWLKGQNVPYQLKNNGSAIWIPANNVHETRLSLASAGLPQGGGVGFEIFDKQSFALTDFVQKVNYTRALQGELSRTIATLGPVETARVHLAIPEKRLFKNQQKPATASVILKLAAGRVLSERQVQGIVHLVSGSIEGLDPENVTIIDQNGAVLSKNQDKGINSALSPDMLEYQYEVERRLEARAQDLLDKALGPNNSMARVTAELDFARFEKTEELFDPEEPVIRSEQLIEEKTGSEIVGGVPGVQSNLQGNTTQSNSATPPSSSSNRTTNYEISKVVSRTVNPVGTVKRLSVAVLVADKMTAAEINEKDKEKKETAPLSFEPRSEEELASLKTMISGALGLDLARGDKIEVTSMPFTDTAARDEMDTVASSMLYEYMPIIRYGLLLLGGVLLYFLMIRPLVKALNQEVVEHYKTVEEMEAEQKDMEEARKQAEEDAERKMDPLTRARLESKRDPVFTAHILKNWINQKG